MSHEQFTAVEKLRSVEVLVAENPEIAGFQSYEYFRNDESAQRKAFMQGDRDSLDLTYPDLTASKVVPVAGLTKDAIIGLMAGERTVKTEALYDAVEYRYSEMFLVSLAERLTSTELAADERAETAQWFRDTNEALYGVPDKEMFSALAHRHITTHLERTHPSDTKAAELQMELRGLIGPIDGSDVEPYAADAEVVERLSGLVRERFDPLVDHIDADKTYTVPEIVEVLDIALQKIGGAELGWHAGVTANSSALAISAHQRRAEVGENRKAIIGEELKAKVIHEVGIHALRSINAERAGWLSAAYGQEGYLAFEEALATALEDAYKGKFADHGIDYYLIAGLTYGQDNMEVRDFREVYEVMWRVNALKAVEDSLITDEKIDKAKSKAFTNCMRMFRGTTTTDKGIIYSKDLAYFVGQERAWTVLDTVHTQDDFEMLLAGKLDLTRDDHVEIARQIVHSQDGE